MVARRSGTARGLVPEVRERSLRRAAWLAEIGPAPHEYFASHEKLASWVTLCPGNYMWTPTGFVDTT